LSSLESECDFECVLKLLSERECVGRVNLGKRASEVVGEMKAK